MAPTLRIYKTNGRSKGSWMASFGGVVRRLYELEEHIYWNEWRVVMKGNKMVNIRITFDERKPNREGLTYEMSPVEYDAVVWCDTDTPYNENLFEIAMPSV